MVLACHFLRRHEVVSANPVLVSGMGTACDAALTLFAVTVQAHKIVLQARSKFFDTMFASGMREGQEGRVTLVDIKAPVFKVSMLPVLVPASIWCRLGCYNHIIS